MTNQSGISFGELFFPLFLLVFFMNETFFSMEFISFAGIREIWFSRKICVTLVSITCCKCVTQNAYYFFDTFFCAQNIYGALSFSPSLLHLISLPASVPLAHACTSPYTHLFHSPCVHSAVERPTNRRKTSFRFSTCN